MAATRFGIGCAVMLTALLVAGCAAKPEDEPAPVTPQQDSAAPAAPPPPEPAPPALAPWDPFGGSGIEFTGCTGAVTGFQFPADTNPGTAPPGWGRAFPDTGAGSQLGLIFYWCQRVHVADFERPAVLMLEVHDEIRIPPQCEAENSRVWVLSSLWVDDAELATLFADRLHVNTVVAEFGLDEESLLPGVVTSRWSWNPVGGTTSWFETAIASSSGAAAHPDADRLVWTVGDELWVWDLEYERTYAQGQILQQGEMHEPMLYAQFAQYYVGTGEVLSAAQGSGAFLRFGDYQCETPL